MERPASQDENDQLLSLFMATYKVIQSVIDRVGIERETRYSYIPIFSSLLSWTYQLRSLAQYGCPPPELDQLIDRAADLRE